jgi:hypothetical protein
VRLNGQATRNASHRKPSATPALRFTAPISRVFVSSCRRCRNTRNVEQNQDSSQFKKSSSPLRVSWWGVFRQTFSPDGAMFVRRCFFHWVWEDQVDKYGLTTDALVEEAVILVHILFTSIPKNTRRKHHAVATSRHCKDRLVSL